jgi:hypothetical protein
MGKGSTPRPFTDRSEFEDNFDRIFRKRINDQKLNNDDMLPEYELNKSTGEVQKVDNGDKPNTVKP